MIRAANGRRLKKLVEDIVSKSNNSFFSSKIDSNDTTKKEEKEENKIDYNGLEENMSEGYNDRED